MRWRGDSRVLYHPGERLLLREPFGNLSSCFRMAIEVGKAVAFAGGSSDDVRDALVDLGFGGVDVLL